MKKNSKDTAESADNGTRVIAGAEMDDDLTTLTGQEHKHIVVTDLELKADDSDDFPSGGIIGHANVFNNIDRQGDVVRPGAFTRTVKAFNDAKIKNMPLIDNHRMFSGTSAVVGRVISLEEDSKGLAFRAMFSSVPEAQVVRTKIKEGILNSLSIGFVVVKDRQTNDGKTRTPIRELLEIKLMEISVVVFPANEKAHISVVKNASVNSFELCDDHERAFDECLATKRWIDRVADGNSNLGSWSDEQWVFFASGFAHVDLSQPTRGDAFAGLLLDVIEGEPLLIKAACATATGEKAEEALAMFGGEQNPDTANTSDLAANDDNSASTASEGSSPVDVEETKDDAETDIESAASGAAAIAAETKAREDSARIVAEEIEVEQVAKQVQLIRAKVRNMRLRRKRKA